MMRLVILLISLSIANYAWALSRWDFFCYDGFDRLQIGARIGAGYSSLPNIKPMLEKGELSPDYKWANKPFIRPTAGIFAEYKFFRAAAEIEGSYYVQGLRLEEHRLRENCEYGIASQFVGLGLNLRLYCTEEFYIGACGRYGFNVSNDMRFVSDKYTRYEDYEGRVRKQMQESFVPGNEISAGLMLGYVLKNGLQLEGRCIFGFSDMIKTLENDYDYSEQNNNSMWIGLTVGYPIIIFKR